MTKSVVDKKVSNFMSYKKKIVRTNFEKIVKNWFKKKIFAITI